MDCLEEHVEPSTNAVDHIIPRPLASHPSLNPNNMSLRSIINCIYLSNFRLHISSAVLVFLQAASRSSVCTPQQRKLFLRRQDQCMWEFWSISERVLELFRHLEFRGEEDCLSVSRLGWVDAMMVAGALKTIAESQLSLSGSGKWCSTIWFCSGNRKEWYFQPRLRRAQSRKMVLVSGLSTLRERRINLYGCTYRCLVGL